MKKAKLKDAYAAAEFTSEQLRALAVTLDAIERRNHMLGYLLREGFKAVEAAERLRWDIRSVNTVIGAEDWRLYDAGIKTPPWLSTPATRAKRKAKAA
jgi:hypothetical protein